MNLQIKRVSENTTIYTMNANGQTVSQVVADLTNAATAMDAKAWVEDMGGTKPVEGVADGTDRLARVRPS